MTGGQCTLCDLPLESTAVTGEDGDRYCCRGCMHVAETLDGVADEPADVTDGTDSEPEEPAQPAPGTERAFFQIQGMHCSTCEVFIEGVGSDAEGVEDVAASYVSETVRVDYDPDEIDPEAVADELTGLGYTAYPREDALAGRRAKDWNEARLIAGALFGMVVMMQYLLLVYPLHVRPPWYDERTHQFLVEMVTSDASVPFFLILFAMTSVVLFVTGGPILRGAYVSLRTRNPNMDLLVALAASAAYVYSTLAVAVGRVDVYYDVTVAIVLVVSVGGYYEGKIKRRATEKLADLSTAGVETATRYEPDGSTTEIDVDDLEDGDRVLVRGGERIPVDGIVSDGEGRPKGGPRNGERREPRAGKGAVDEAVITGESLPVTKRAGDTVVGGSILTEGSLVVQIEGEPTSSVDRIADLVWDLQSATSGVQQLADRLATIFVPLVSTIAIIVTGAYLLLGASAPDAMLVGLTVLIVSCPCALGLATPLAVASSVREALDRGVVVFDETVFERIRDVDVVVFDKTGTLTTGTMEVLDARAPDDLLERVAILEQRSAHPVAGAIADAFGPNASATDGEAPSTTGPHSSAGADPATDGGVPAGESAAMDADDTENADDTAADIAADDRLSEFTSYATGVGGTVDGEDVLVGHPDLFAERGWTVPDDLAESIATERGFGRVPVLVGREGTAAGLVVVGDEPREGWDETIAGLADRGVAVVVLTGDDEEAASFFRAHDGVERVFAGVPPEGKAETVRRLRSRGKTAMVGDGTNDAPALASADLGIALGGGTALAADAADVAIVDDDLSSLETVFAIATAARRRVRQNIAWAFAYNAIAIPVVIAGFLNPLFAALAMGLSSALVVTNSSRALLDDEE
ncbi:heavy metal translocating P-type ATPase [Halovivax limisalsi]|uniref:heavy metal translocating P-type ATPase n=1 Tax=Halovivax limisalsi TaxID=1453760 RepID=UPI001FFC9FF7|nr:cation-translocating P-type ATPase [Halovivax limisalsi]